MKIAYIMSRFPHLPETFILREMIELETHGLEIALYPLMCQEQTVIHQEAHQWLARANCTPFFSGAVLRAFAITFIKRPLKLAGLWLRTLLENLTSPKFLVRALTLFPKAVYFARQIQLEKIEHIHAHYATHPALTAWIIHQLTGISYSMTVHAHDIFVEKAMLETKLRDAEFIVPISQFNREYLAQEIGSWVRSKSHIIHCGIFPKDYPSPQAPSWNNKTFEIITIGSLQPYKGQKYLIEACAILRDRQIPFRCRIIGGGELHAQLEQLIQSFDLESQVELLGPLPQDEVARLLHTAHCYVQPSIITPSGKMEGIPVSLMEALACNLPVIATELSGIPELIRPTETGALVAPEDPQGLVNALVKMYENPEEAIRMATAGRDLVLKEFDLNKNGNLLARLFEMKLSDSKIQG
jgi:colanic acid/amylovoran biosynthesis glycosyltransferase